MKKVVSIVQTLFFLILNASCFCQNLPADGYKGIWFSLGQMSEYGDKYSGGLGTYTSSHVPVAVYSHEAKKTFFVYGGTTAPGEKHLLIMISYFDHRTKSVPRPVIVFDKMGVNDPHDNAALSIDDRGYLWVFISGRGRTRPGIIFRSHKPYCIDSFEKIFQGEITYPQPWFVKGEGFILMYSRYTAGRELYLTKSNDGISWTPPSKLAGMGGHYQVTNMKGNRLVSVFNYHPGGNADKRTNLYCIQTEDFGRTWKTIEGDEVIPPLEDIKSKALVKDYESEKKLVYLNDLNFDSKGNPVILVVVSRDYRPGPPGDPHEWYVIHRENNKWDFHKVCESTHNYDMGSLYIEDDNVWRIIGPTEPGPVRYGTGGEVAMWISRNEGMSWEKFKILTSGSLRNHSYVRRPLNASGDFYAFWADGDAEKLSESHLYFTCKRGDCVWELPYYMAPGMAKPVKVKN